MSGRSLRAERAGGSAGDRLADYCDAVIRAGVLLSLIISPLFFNPRTQHTFDPDKAALLRSVVLAALVAWLVRRLRTLMAGSGNGAASRPAGRGRPARGALSADGRRPSRLAPTALTLAALLLLVTHLIGTLASIVPRVSIWGAYERGQGLYTIAAYVGLFFLARDAVRSRHDRQLLIDTILLVSLPVSVYAILQHFDLDPLVFQTGGAAVTLRSISTLGNPIFLGAYLVMVIPLTAFQIYRLWLPDVSDRPNRLLAGLCGILLVVQLAAVFFAQSRGPVLGLIGGVGFGGLVWVAHRGTRRLLAGAVVALAVGAVLIGLLPALLPGTSGLGRLAQLVDPASRTSRQRFLIWQGVLELVTSEPARVWIGYGPETLRGAVAPHMPAELASLKPDEDFDRAHNAVLDVWAATGLLGLAAYLFIIGAVVWRGLRVSGRRTDPGGHWRFLLVVAPAAGLGALVAWFGVGPEWVGVGLPLGLLAGAGALAVWQNLRAGRQYRRLSEESALAVALLAGVAAHVIETVVGIAIVATSTLFWVYAALLTGVSASEAEPAPVRPGGGVPSASRLASATWGLVTGVALGLLSFSLLSAGEVRGGFAWGLLAGVVLLFGVAHVGMGRPGGGSPFGYLATASGVALGLWVLIVLPWPPLDIAHPTVAVFVFALAAQMLLAASLTGAEPLPAGTPRLSRAEWALYAPLILAGVTLIWLTNVNLMRADVFYKQGLGLMAAGELQGATQALETSVVLAPTEDRFHSTAGAAYADLAGPAGTPDARAAWLARSEAHLREARRLDPFRADHARNLGVLYRLWAGSGSAAERAPPLRQALSHYEQAAALNPISVRIWREWGESYAALGEWDAAVRSYEESLRLNAGFIETWLRLAEARLHMADYAGARQAYEQALGLDQARVLQERQAAVNGSPDDPLAHEALALVYAALREPQAAMAEAETARRLLAEEPPDWPQFLAALE